MRYLNLILVHAHHITSRKILTKLSSTCIASVDSAERASVLLDRSVEKCKARVSGLGEHQARSPMISKLPVNLSNYSCVGSASCSSLTRFRRHPRTLHRDRYHLIKQPTNHSHQFEKFISAVGEWNIYLSFSSFSILNILFHIHAVCYSGDRYILS